MVPGRDPFAMHLFPTHSSVIPARHLRTLLCRFAVGEGDLVSALNAWHAWQESGRSGKWAHMHYLNHRTLLRAADNRAQLTHHLRCPFFNFEG